MAETESNFSATICLPQTSFPMKADLAQNEPKIIDYWQKEQIYRRLKQNRQGKAETFILHDGPPYANGNFHVGHGLNKTLKDIINKYHILQGKYVPYVPGWDCHGLPIEHAVVKKLNDKKSPDAKDPVAIRLACKEYAANFVKIQAKDQSRFGVLWDESSVDEFFATGKSHGLYLTMSNEYEANILEVFRQIYAKDLIYKGKKPVYWCPFLGTAHAEAEIEYMEHESNSVYVKFPVIAHGGAEVRGRTDAQERTSISGGAEVRGRTDAQELFVVIWTTTPWTLPANLAVCFHPDFVYAKYQTEKGILIIAEGLEEKFFNANSLTFTNKTIISKEEIEKLDVRHPFIDRASQIVFGDHVTLEAGTGIVHTAPGHGQDDYKVGLKYGLEPYSPIDDYGKYTAEYEPLKGVKVFDANDIIIGWLKERNLLLAHGKFKHSYPHSWRSRKPLIMRATSQWFMKMEPLRRRAMEITNEVKWVPEWGKNRFLSMIESRPDWCLSRQRYWGVPIPEFICGECGHSHLTDSVMLHIIGMVRQQGIEIWFNKNAKELLPEKTVCSNCGSGNLSKGSNILDVWFDSGVSWFAVLAANPDLQLPAQVYLEGSDQHRGWFQSSLWPSLALTNKAPFETVITHGYVLDEKGRAMSKSLGNVISPVDDIIPKYGADIFRLWVSSEDFRSDNTIGYDLLKQLSESYRKIRNTFRYLLGNLADGRLSNNSDDISKIQVNNPLDQWVLHELAVLMRKVKLAYENYEFHQIYQLVTQFCAVTLSNDYFEIVRDRLYCDGNSRISSPERQSVIRTLSVILKQLKISLAPIMSFTMEEIQRIVDPEKSVFEETWPTNQELASLENNAIADAFTAVFEKKRQVNISIEEARKQQLIGSSTECSVEFAEADFKILKEGLPQLSVEELARYFVVSEVVITKSTAVTVKKAPHQKCSRCWLYRPLNANQVCRRCELYTG